MSKNKQQADFRELADWVISQTIKAGADDCRVRISKRKFVDINYRDKKPEVIKEATTQSLYLEVFDNKRYAGQSTPDFRKSTLEGFIAGMIENAGVLEEDPFRTLPDPKYYEGRNDADLQLFDQFCDRLSPEERHEMTKKVEAACLDEGGEKVISVEAGEYDETYEEFVKSSNGFEGTVKTTVFSVGASMTARDEGDRKPNGYNYVTCRFMEDIPDLEETGRLAAKRTLDLMEGKKVKTEKLPVIIENRSVGRVLGGLADPVSAGNIQQKRSFLAEYKGKTIGSKYLTIVDDPFIPRGLGSMYYDEDGFPARKRNLFTEGVLNDFLVDWYYSRKLGWEPNSGSFSNLIIPPGSKSVAEIIRELGTCLLITDFIGGNSNSTTGDFSVGIIGKLYEKGEFVQNVAEMNIADNHINFWRKLIGVANDPWIYSQLRVPSLVFDDVVVAGI
jgi:PmbA protein